MTLYEKVRIGLIILQILVTLGVPFVVIKVNTHLNTTSKPCEIKDGN
jgi:hypothetical protein